MNKVKGAFVFRNEGNRCMTSIYLEHQTNTPYTECCKSEVAEISDDPFEGNFHTFWLEPGDIHIANLSIRRNGDVYNLEWTNISRSDWQYQGTAMLFEGKLAGCYWKQ